MSTPRVFEKHDVIAPEVQDLWNAARRFTTGVAVATTGSGDDVHGATVSAFTFVSWEPTLVSICLCSGSSLLAKIREHGGFMVNVLASHQAHLAKHFADPRRTPGPQQFDGIAWSPERRTGVPILTGAVVRLDCEVEQTITFGDHEFVLARALSAEVGEGAPLLYFAGRLFAGMIN